MVVRPGSGVGTAVSRIAAVVVAAGLLLGIAGTGPAEAFVNGPVQTLVAGPEARGDVKAFGDYVVCPEADVVHLDPIGTTPGPFRVILYDVVNGGYLDIDERPGSHVFADIGDGFVAYTTVLADSSGWELRLYDIATGARSVLASGPLETSPVPACAAGLVAWAEETGLHVFDVGTGIATEYPTPDGCWDVSAAGDRVAWVDVPPTTDDLAGVNVLDVTTGEIEHLDQAAFSANSCEVSGAGVVVEGEGPGYRPYILLWDPAGDTVVEIATAERGYVSNARASSRYIAWSDSLPDHLSTRAIAVMDLSDGTHRILEPAITATLICDVEGSRIWCLATLAVGSTAICYVDLDDDPAPVVPGPAVPAVTPSPSSEETTSAEPSATVVATEVPEPESEPEPEDEPDEMAEEEGEAERNDLVPLLAGGLAVVLAGIGLVAYGKSRRSA